jgi:hypothetical protein
MTRTSQVISLPLEALRFLWWVIIPIASHLLRAAWHDLFLGAYDPYEEYHSGGYVGSSQDYRFRTVDVLVCWHSYLSRNADEVEGNYWFNKAAKGAEA